MELFRTILKELDQQQQNAGIGHLLGGQAQPQTGQQQQGGQNDIGNLLGGGQPDQQDPNANQGDQRPDQNQELDNMLDQAASQDPDKQGLIRQVDQAHLVFKRQTEEGTYEELWIYNVGKMQDELKIRKAVLAGTDIPPGKTRSPDGLQTYDIWSAGNGEMLHLKGLPN